MLVGIWASEGPWAQKVEKKCSLSHSCKARASSLTSLSPALNLGPEKEM